MYPHDVELLEVMKRALLLGRPTVEAREKGEWLAVDLMSDLSLWHNLPAPVSLPFLPDLLSEIM